MTSLPRTGRRPRLIVAPDEPPPGLTRRQVLRAASLAGTAGAVAALVPALAPDLAPAAGARTAAPDAAAPEPRPLSDLPVAFGTPTDLAANARDGVWALDHDGVVLRFQRDLEFWTPVQVDWAEVLTYGSPVLARWGRPSGANWMVLLIGTEPDPPTTGPTTPTQPTGTTTATATSTGQPGTTTTTTTTTPTTATPTTTTTPTTGKAWAPIGAGPASGGPVAGGPLAWTGFDAGRFGLIGLALVAAGAALVTRRRRVATDRGSTGPDDAGPAGGPPTDGGPPGPR